MYKDILIAVDLNDERSWSKALPTAVEYCKAFGSTLHVMTVLPDFGMSIVSQYFPADFEDKAMAAARESLHAFIDANVGDGIKVQAVVGHGSIVQEILGAREAAGCDLIIMQSHASEIEELLIGANATKVVRHAPCSVLVVRE